MAKKLLVLGAGIYQVPLIECAKSLGIYTIVASIPGNYPGFALADEIAYVDTTDAEGLVALAREKKIDGVCTAGTDVSVPALGAVCDALGLKGVSRSAAQIAADKALMKDAFEREGVRVAESVKVAASIDLADAADVCKTIGYPVIVKAVDSSGSRGITRVGSEEELEAALEAAKQVTRSDTILIERFLEGDEFGAQAFVQDGILEFCLPHGDYVFHGNTGVPIGHFAPIDMDEVADEAREQVELAIRAVGLDNCALNIDFILCDGQVYVLEIGARSGATCLAELVGIYYGYNYYEKIVRVALGERVSFASTLEKPVPNASHLLMSDKDGVIVSQVNENPTDDDSVLDVQFDYQVGDTVHAFRIGPHRIGHVITKGDTLQEAKDNLERAMSRVHIEVR